MIRSIGQKALNAFNAWFTSAAGIFHTLIIVLFVVLGEEVHWLKDEHGFWLLYWLTVYSAVTQPALAYVARRSGDRQEDILRQQAETIAHLESLVAHLGVPQEKTQ